MVNCCYNIVARCRLRDLHSGSLLDPQQGGMKFIGGVGETFIETRNRLLRVRNLKSITNSVFLTRKLRGGR